MKQMRDEFGTSFIFSTHDPKVVNIAETIFTKVKEAMNKGVAKGPFNG